MAHKEDNRRRQDDPLRLDTSVIEQNSYTWGARLSTEEEIKWAPPI